MPMKMCEKEPAKMIWSNTKRVLWQHIACSMERGKYPISSRSTEKDNIMPLIQISDCSGCCWSPFYGLLIIHTMQSTIKKILNVVVIIVVIVGYLFRIHRRSLNDSCWEVKALNIR